MFDEVARSQIGRLVAFVLTPVLLPVVTAVAAWLQDAIGIDLDGAELTGYIVAIAAGVALVIYQWLRNRGAWERQVAELEKLYEAATRAGDEVAAASAAGERGPVAVPPGIQG